MTRPGPLGRRQNTCELPILRARESFENSSEFGNIFPARTDDSFWDEQGDQYDDDADDDELEPTEDGQENVRWNVHRDRADQRTAQRTHPSDDDHREHPQRERQIERLTREHARYGPPV